MSVAAVDPIAETWSARNQRWLTQRFALWRERLEQPDRSAAGIAGLEEPTDFQPAALRLRALFGLTPFETELIMLAAGVEIDASLRSALATAQALPPRQPVRLAFSLALSLLPDSHWDAISPLAPLRYWSLLDVDTSGGFAYATARIDERILHYLTGVAAVDDRLRGIVRIDEAGCGGATDEQTLQITRALAHTRDALVMLHHDPTDAERRRAARAIATNACAHADLRPLWVDAAVLPGDPRDLAELARRTDREAALVNGAIVVAFDPDMPPTAVSARFLAALRSPAITIGALAAHHLVDLSGRHVRRFDVRIAEAAFTAGTPSQQMMDALREASRGALDTLAQRIDSDTTFDDLVVPPAVASQLRDIAGQLRDRRQVHEEWGFGDRSRRGLGIAALFTGESGTGKTLAAEAIANAARLDLYRIDLSSVINKYVGETEKNLARLFDAAERSGAVLLFDEADALFGKRSEVKDSQDRYANIEVAYLLQRVETYRGLAILTTNMKGALDRSFLRRLRFVVQFPFPDEAARERIWHLHLPPRAPLGAIDYAALAKLQLSGGHIRSVALNAAFAAARDGGAIEQTDLIAAARAEFAKLERTFVAPRGVA